MDEKRLVATLDELERLWPGDPGNAWLAVYLAERRPKFGFRPLSHEAVAAMEAG